MPENPYEPSQLKPWRPLEAGEPGLRVWAILLGIATDMGGSFVFGTAASIVLTLLLLSQGVAEEDLLAHMEGPLFNLFGLVTGLGFTLLGGFVAGARQSEDMHGAIVGLLSTLLSIPFVWFSPSWYVFVSVLSVVPTAVFGAYLAKLARRKPQDWELTNNS